MLDFQQKNKIRRIVYSRPAVVVVLLIALYFLYSTWSIYSKMVQSRERVEQTQKKLLALSANNIKLENEIGELQTQDGIEKEIRSKFGQAKPGEQMAVIVTDHSVPSTTTPVSKGFLARIKSFFGF